MTKRDYKKFKLAVVLNNLIWLIIYLAIIFVYYLYITPNYPLPYSNFSTIISMILTLVYLAIGIFLIFTLVKSIVKLFNKE